MRIVRFLLVVLISLLIAGCGDPAKEQTPLDTLKKYVEAAKNKDITQMKLLLSEATLKLHTDQAKAQNVTLDEIVQRETFFAPEQRNFGYRNERIEGETATVDVRNNFGGWDQIFLVKENGSWKIDKKGTAQQMIDQSESDVKDLDKQIEDGRIDLDKIEGTDGSATPTLHPATPLDGADTEDKGLLAPAEDVPGSPPSTLPTKQP